MGRLTKEQQEERAKAEALKNGGQTDQPQANQGEHMPNPGSQGVVDNPDTNTHEGIQQNHANAEAAAVGDGTLFEGSVGNNGVPGDQGPAGDQVEGTEGSEKEEKRLVTEDDMQLHPFLAEMGVAIGDEFTTQLIDKVGVYLQENPWLLDPSNPDYRPKPEYITEDDLKVYPFLTNTGLKVGDVKNEETAKIMEDYLSVHPWLYDKDHPDYKPQPKKDGQLPVYHGDFLSEAQLGLPPQQITYDWDAVTAPEHLAINPQSKPRFTED